MSKLPAITCTFDRKHLGALNEKMPVPIGWFVLPYNLMLKKEVRRKYHGKWFTIESDNKKIYRVLRFGSKLHGTIRDDKHKDILLDWVGWIDLCGRDEDVEIPLKLKITKSTLMQQLIYAGINHPEPINRMSAWLAIISISLGILSVLIACLT